MRKLFLNIVLFILSLNAFAQVDSNTVISNIKHAQIMTDLNTAISYLDETVDLADEIKYLNGRIEARRILAPLQLKANQRYDGLKTYLQLINILEKQEYHKELFDVYVEISDYYRLNKLPNNSANYLEKALILAKKESLEHDSLNLHIQLGHLYFEAFDNEKAMKNYNSADSLALIKEDLRSSIKIKRSKVKILKRQQNYNEVLKGNLEILELLQEIGTIEEITAQLNNVGFSYKKLNKNDEALDYFKQTLELREENGYNDESHVALLINIAITLQNLRQQGESLIYLKRAHNAVDGTKNPEFAIEVLDLTSIAFLSQGQPYKALQENITAMNLADKNKLINQKKDLYLTQSIIYEHLLEYDQALDSYKKHLQINDSIAIHQKLLQENVLLQQIAVEKSEKEIQGLIASNDIKDYQLEQLKLESENKDIQLKNQQLAAKEKLQDLTIKQQELEKQNTDKELQAVKAKEENQRLLIIQKELEEEKLQNENALLESESKLQKSELTKRKAVNRSLFVIALLALVVMGLAVFASLKIRKNNKLIKVEKAKSDKLLLNILPESTAEELKTMGQSLPRQYDSVTVLFTDFKGFTQITEDMHPENLVQNLDEFFAGFDDIMLKYGIEKIKTIGDAYMCACGIPDKVKDHALVMVKASQEMLAFANKLNATKKEKNLQPWNLRIGINSGHVVAGVIGKNKFQYDIWGDSVNLASRMESSGEPNKINISHDTYNLVKDQIKCTYRGEVLAKNKGKVKMYFVDQQQV